MGAPIINYNMTTTFRQRPRYSDRKIELMNSKERIQFSRELNEQHYVFSATSITWDTRGYSMTCITEKSTTRSLPKKSPTWKH